MASIKGTNVAAMIAPFDTEDTFPTHDAKYGKGGYRSVDTIAERDAIPASRLTDGCVCYVGGTDKNEYRYNEATSSWTKIEKGGGGGSSVNVVDNLNSTSPTDALSANQGRVIGKRVSEIERGLGETETYQPSLDETFSINVKRGEKIVADMHSIEPFSAVYGVFDEEGNQIYGFHGGHYPSSNEGDIVEFNSSVEGKITFKLLSLQNYSLIPYIAITHGFAVRMDDAEKSISDLNKISGRYVNVDFESCGEFDYSDSSWWMKINREKFKSNSIVKFTDPYFDTIYIELDNTLDYEVVVEVPANVTVIPQSGYEDLVVSGEAENDKIRIFSFLNNTCVIGNFE